LPDIVSATPACVALPLILADLLEASQFSCVSVA
jgi:hypothetical protein